MSRLPGDGNFGLLSGDWRRVMSQMAARPRPVAHMGRTAHPFVAEAPPCGSLSGRRVRWRVSVSLRVVPPDLVEGSGVPEAEEG
jgi:hypothetical protein